MKAPDQNQAPPAPHARRINYSMLPPEKLPSWLLEKNTPPKIHNFSMRPPDATVQMPELVQARQAPSPEVLAPPPAPVEPKTTEQVLMAEPENVPEVVAIAPAEDQVHDIFLEPSINVSGAERLNSPEHQEPVVVPERPTVSVAEAPTAILDSPTIQPEVQVAPPPRIEAPNPAVQPTQAPGYPYNAPAPASKSFGDLILDNSNTTIIIVSGIIVFAIVLIVLLSIGVI